MSLLQAAFLLPFVLVVPGCAITAALFPPGTIKPSERVVYSFVFSISAAALGGLAVQFVLGLGFGAWLGLLLAISIGAGAIALARWDVAPRQVTPDPPMRLPARPLWALGFLAALAIAGLSVAIAVQGVRDQQSQQVFTSLWATPATGSTLRAAVAEPLTVGVWNHGGRAAYRLRVSAHGRMIEELPVRLGAEQRWQRTLPPPVTTATRALLITLFRGSKPYRKVELNIARAR